LKLPIYAAQGVAHAWLVDPVAQTVEVYRLENGHWLLLMTYGGDVPMAAEPFAAVTIDLGRIWAW
jgi:Uma2 family endonuclease